MRQEIEKKAQQQIMSNASTEENLGKIENGIVAVTAYGLLEGITFPLIFEVYKPKERLLEGDTYLSKPKIAVEMIRHLQNLGFKFKLVLADSLYGESHSTFIKALNELQLNYAVAIRSNHGVWLPLFADRETEPLASL